MQGKFQRTFNKALMLAQRATTQEYWDQRYRLNDISGYGSEKQNLQYKISVLNRFIDDNRIKGLIDVGCGSGKILQGIRKLNYIGIDVSSEVISINKAANVGARMETALFYSLEEAVQLKIDKLPLVISSEVIFCLNKREIKSHLQLLEECTSRYILIFSYEHPSRLHMAWTPNHNWTTPKNWRLLESIESPVNISKALYCRIFEIESISTIEK